MNRRYFIHILTYHGFRHDRRIEEITDRQWFKKDFFSIGISDTLDRLITIINMKKKTINKFDDWTNAYLYLRTYGLVE